MRPSIGVRGAVWLVLAPALTGCCLETVSGFGSTGSEGALSTSTGGSTAGTTGGSVNSSTGSGSGSTGGGACCPSAGQATAVGSLGFQVSSAGFTPQVVQLDGGPEVIGAYIFITSAVDFTCGGSVGSGLSIPIEFVPTKAVGSYLVSGLACYIEFFGGKETILPTQGGSYAIIDSVSVNRLSGSYDVKIQVPDGGRSDLSGRFDLPACAQLDPCAITGC